MVRKCTEISKRAFNSITIQLQKLIRKYGEREVRLVVNKFFQKQIMQNKLEAEIESREDELRKLKSRVR